MPFIEKKERFYSFSAYLKNTFGEKVYKLSFDAEMTCPNRDGSKGVGGCAFCRAGSSDFAEKNVAGLDEQIEAAKERVRGKTKAKKFIAYFQSYSGTYAPAERLKELFLPVITREDIAAVSIGTRPDCLGDEVTALLKYLAAIKPVFVELGLQTIHDKTADEFNRCYKTAEYFDACERLKATGVNVVTHVIFGLPGETEEMMMDTIRAVGKVTDGIKIHSLYVLDGTAMEEAYARGLVQPLTLEKYADLLCKAIELIPENVVIHRITGDPPKKNLIAPVWTRDKKRVLNYINGEMKRRRVAQGRLAEDSALSLG